MFAWKLLFTQIGWTTYLICEIDSKKLICYQLILYWMFFVPGICQFFIGQNVDSSQWLIRVYWTRWLLCYTSLSNNWKMNKIERTQPSPCVCRLNSLVVHCWYSKMTEFDCSILCIDIIHSWSTGLDIQFVKMFKTFVLSGSFLNDS